MYAATTRVAAPPAPIHIQTPEFFKGLTEVQQNYIIASGAVNKFGSHETIIRADDPAIRLYMIRTGHVNFFRIAETGEQILLARLIPNDIFGLATLIAEPLHYMGTAETLTDCQVVSWERDSIRRLGTTYPLLAQNGLRIALRYVRDFTKRHLALVVGSAEERLALALTQLGSRSGHMLPTGLELDIKNEDLASLADISVFTASRLLKRWERKGAVEKHRGRVLILCPEKLLVA